MKLVKDWMSNDFKMIRGNASPLEAIALHAGSPYIVVENASQQAIGVVTGAELEGAISTGATPLVQQILTGVPLLTVGCDLGMQAVVESPLLETLVQTARLAVVTDDANQTVGVLSADAIRQFIRSGSSQQKGTVLGGDAFPYVASAELAGSLLPLTAFCICGECYHRNELSAAQWSALTANPSGPAPTCQNPDLNVPQHLLKLN